MSEVEQVEEHGDSLIISVRHFAHGAGSGVDVERREIHVWRFSGDKVASLTEFPDLESARASLAKSAN